MSSSQSWDYKRHCLLKAKLGRYAKTVGYFLKAKAKNSCTVVVTANAVNLGDKNIASLYYKESWRT